ncbi:MAG: NUDIX hydrolase [Acidimicrobiales bacterium]
MTVEVLDVFDDRGRHLGVRRRDEVHAEGLWHRTFHLLVVADRSHGSTVVLQRRALAKTSFPGLLDLTATGHLAAGEEPREGVRELREEVGIDVDPGDLLSLGVRRMVDETPEGLNREFCHVFLVRDDRALDDYRPDVAEVSAVVEIAVDDALTAVHDPTRRVPARERPAGGPTSPTMLGADQFVPEPGLVDLVGTPAPRSYWIALMGAAAAFATGERRLAI